MPYGLLGRLSRWILWIITRRSMVLPVCASNEYDSWHIAQYCRSKRAPPWNTRLSWQALQVSLSTISRPDSTTPPVVGAQVNTALLAGMNSLAPAGRRRISRPTRCTSAGSNGMSSMPFTLCAKV